MNGPYDNCGKFKEKKFMSPLWWILTKTKVERDWICWLQLKWNLCLIVSYNETNEWVIWNWRKILKKIKISFIFEVKLN